MKNNSLRKKILMNAAVTLGILLIPFVAMLFTESVNWTISDFVAAGILIFVTLNAFLLAFKIFKTKQQRTIVGIVIFLLFLYLYAELAVGIFFHFGS